MIIKETTSTTIKLDFIYKFIKKIIYKKNTYETHSCIVAVVVKRILIITWSDPILAWYEVYNWLNWKFFPLKSNQMIWSFYNNCKNNLCICDFLKSRYKKKEWIINYNTFKKQAQHKRDLFFFYFKTYLLCIFFYV